MMDAEQVQFFARQFPGLTDQDVADVLSISKLIQVERGEKLIRCGESRPNIFFILSGIVRAYYIKENGQEMTPFFWSEHQVTGSWEAIYLRKPSELEFEVIESGLIISTDFVAFKKLVDKSDTLLRVYLEMVESILTETLIHTQSVKNEKPEDRYKHLMRTEADLMARISQKHIASHLGITPISFSRMKKRMEDLEEL